MKRHRICIANSRFKDQKSHVTLATELVNGGRVDAATPTQEGSMLFDPAEMEGSCYNINREFWDWWPKETTNFTNLNFYGIGVSVWRIIS